MTPILLVWALSSPPAGACYGRAAGGTFVVGNAEVEIGIDKKTGAVVSLLNKPTRTRFLGRGAADAFSFDWSTWPLEGVKEAEPWSAVGGTTVVTARQRVSSMTFERTPDGGVLTVAYDRMQLERRTLAVSVRYQIRCVNGSDETFWTIALDNQDRGVVREVRFPILGGIAAADALVLPNHGGERIDAPLEALSDEVPVIGLEYPARASMNWLSLFTARAALSMASHDRELTYTRMAFGRRGSGDGAALWMTKHPFAGPGRPWQSPPFSVAIAAGDWHHGADLYRTWLRSWVKPPDIPRRVRERIGSGGGLYIKDRTEKTVARYEDLVAKAERRSASLEPPSVMAIGWFKNGHDTYFPEYDAIPELGGAKALVAAIDKVHGKGGTVTAYMNGRLANIETATYKQHGKRWSVLGRAPGLGVGSVNFFELHERWNPEWERDQRGEGWFAVMCPSAKGWQDHIVGQAVHVVRDYKFDAIFFDQPGSYYAELCHSPHHGHATPAHAWGPGQLEIFRRLRTEARAHNPEFALSTEGMNDVLGQYLDFHTDKNPLWEPMRTHPAAKTFPELWRYTVPEYVTSNGAVAYSFPPARDKIFGPYYRFVLGIRGIGRSFGKNVTGTPEDEARLGEVVSRIERLWHRAGPLLWDGRFVDDVGLAVSSPAIFARAHTSADAVAIPVWNTTDASVSFTVTFDPAAVGEAPFASSRAERLDGEVSEPTTRAGRASVKTTLGPHDADVVVFRRL